MDRLTESVFIESCDLTAAPRYLPRLDAVSAAAAGPKAWVNMEKVQVRVYVTTCVFCASLRFYERLCLSVGRILTGSNAVLRTARNSLWSSIGRCCGDKVCM